MAEVLNYSLELIQERAAQNYSLEQIQERAAQPEKFILDSK
jgi:hypothetical protein